MKRLDGRRLGLRFPGGEARYYDIDADGRVYWLQPRGSGKNLLQRWRVRDEALIRIITQHADEAGAQPSEPAPER